MGKYLVFIFAIFGLVLFFSPQKVEAADTDVVINEILANAPNDPSSHAEIYGLEWVELYNNGIAPVDLKDWTFDGKKISTSSLLLQSDSYLIIARDDTLFKTQYPNVVCQIVKLGISLLNSSDEVILVNTDAINVYNEKFKWITDAGDNISWERIDPSMPVNDSNKHASLVSGGTPGEENSVSKPPPVLPIPLAPSLLLPIDTQVFTGVNSINFSWADTDTQPLTFEFILSTHADLSDPIIDEPNLTELKYLAEDLAWGQYYWQVIASNGADKTASVIFSFEIKEPIYSNSIIINELMPDPDGDEVKNEWIELYNNSAETVDLAGWVLSDIKGSIKKYTIIDKTIAPFGYAIFYRSQTGIVLNNDQDGAALYQPNGNILYETSVFADGGEDLSWARTTSGKWKWTEKTTPGKTNIIYLTPEEDPGGKGGTEETIILNTKPIEIKTGEFRNFEQYLVAVTGTVISTSGNTFYLDDGSGQAKIYIQDKTGIQKPPMHKGDIFQIIGIVNLYRGTWRILPQKQEDIKLIESVQNTATAGATTTKKSTSTSTKSTTTSTSAQARAPTEPLIKEVKAAENINSANTSMPKNSFWFQIIEALTGLAIIFLILLVIKIRRFPKVKVIGGHFGEDET